MFVSTTAGFIDAAPTLIWIVRLPTCSTIANAIFASRENYASAIARARPLIESLPSRESVAFLCKPFIQPCEGKRNWLVWGTKFWHFLNPEAFPIEDSRVDSFFKLAWNQDPVKRYLVMMHAFREFALTHEAWVPALRAADEDFSSVNKLWDKVFFGVRGATGWAKVMKWPPGSWTLNSCMP